MTIKIEQVDKRIYKSFWKYLHIGKYKSGSNRIYAPVFLQIALLPIAYFMKDAPGMAYPFILFFIILNAIIFLSAYFEYNSIIIFEDEKIYTRCKKNSSFKFYSCEYSQIQKITQDTFNPNRYTIHYTGGTGMIRFNIINKNIPEHVLTTYLKKNNEC